MQWFERVWGFENSQKGEKVREELRGEGRYSEEEYGKMKAEIL